jgi:PhzF family phenazine biosynthesis protein
MLRQFSQVDVFTAVPYLGNPLAVVLDGSGLSTADMQRFARWTNLSETTFVLPPTSPEADYRVRIFHPEAEIPFAGHPTIGTCHAWLEAGGVPRDPAEVVQECGSGLIRVRRLEEGLAFEEPPLIRSGEVDDATVDSLAEQLGVAREAIVDSQWVDNGPGWVGVLLRSAGEVLALRPQAVIQDIGVIGPHAEGSDVAFEVRAFYPQGGSVVEDPVTGSLNASFAGWLIRSGRASAPWVAAQGTALGRAGRVTVTQDDDGRIWVGGRSVTCILGEVEL